MEERVRIDEHYNKSNGGSNQIHTETAIRSEEIIVPSHSLLLGLSPPYKSSLNHSELLLKLWQPESNR